MTSIQQGLRPFLATAGIVFLSSGTFLSAADPGEKTAPAQEAESVAATPAKDSSSSASSTVVVSATKTETEAWKTASSITVIDRPEIEREQYRLLPDALRRVPGLTIADRGFPGSVAGVFMRGTKTEHTSVLIDGRPVPMNFAGAFNIETTPLDNIERIEVLRGPAASLYGGKTIGGVINIITRTGKGLEHPETAAFAEAGSYGSFRKGLSTLGAAGDLDWALELGHADIEGQRINSRFRENSAAGKVGYQIAESLRFDLDTRYYDSKSGVPGSRLTNDPNDFFTTEYWSLSPRLVWDVNDQWRQTLTYSFSNFRQAAIVVPVSAFNPNNRVTVRTHYLEYQSDVKITDRWSLTAGASMQDQGYNRYNDDLHAYDIDQAQTNLAVYVQTQAEVAPGLNLLGGLRYDAYSDFDDALTWRTGASYRVPVIGTLLHANYGTAFSTPSPQDREPALFGNANLAKPELSRGFEFGIEQPIPAAKANLRATFFQNNLKDTYQFDLATFAIQAIGRARTRGIELEAAWDPCDILGFSAAYTYLDADDLSNSARLVRRPRATVSASMQVRPRKDLAFSLSTIYTMGREDFDPVTFAQTDLEDYVTVRVAANYKLNRHVEIFARIENAFGQKYEEVAGYPATGTGAYAGVKLRF